MSFPTIINNILEGSQDLVQATDGNIFGVHYPDALATTKTAVVFTYKKDAATHTLQKKNTLQEFNLVIWILSLDNEINENIVPIIRGLLDDYEDDNILDLIFEDEDGGVDQEKQRYYKSLIYRATYQD